MKDSIFEAGHRFEFFEAVRVLRRLYPDREPIGGEADPGREVARFDARVSLSFPASQIQEVRPGEGENPQPQVTVNFMGLTGPLGVLPHRYTELLIQRIWLRDRTLKDFLDIFNHRLVSLFYRAWEKYRLAATYEQGGDDRITYYLRAFIGMATAGLTQRLALEDQGLLLYAGLFNQQPRSASALEGILRDFFGCPSQVIQFQGRWVRLGSENETRLGVRNTILGVETVLGAQIWDRQSKFRIRMGPLSFEKFDGFLPGARAHDQVMQLARLFAGNEYDFDLQLILSAPEVPACRLASGGAGRTRLGWSTWLKTQDFCCDAADTILPCKR